MAGAASSERASASRLGVPTTLDRIVNRAESILGERFSRTREASADDYARAQRALFGESTEQDSRDDPDLYFYGLWPSHMKLPVLQQINRLRASKGFKHYRVRTLDSSSLVFDDPTLDFDDPTLAAGAGAQDAATRPRQDPPDQQQQQHRVNPDATAGQQQPAGNDVPPLEQTGQQAVESAASMSASIDSIFHRFNAERENNHLTVIPWSRILLLCI
eukprot:SAG31_NODE_1828_length_7159_cov_58.418980_6_plen_217_part_00